MAKMNGFMAMSTHKNLKADVEKLYDIARYLKDGGKPEYGESIYKLANSKRNELQKLERVLMETEIDY